jgi:hypothetical protein
VHVGNNTEGCKRVFTAMSNVGCLSVCLTVCCTEYKIYSALELVAWSGQSEKQFTWYRFVAMWLSVVSQHHSRRAIPIWTITRWKQLWRDGWYNTGETLLLTEIRKISCSRDCVGTWWDSVTVWCWMFLLRLKINNISVHDEFIFWSDFVNLPLPVERSWEGTWVVIFWLWHDAVCWMGTNILWELFSSSENMGATGSSKMLQRTYCAAQCHIQAAAQQTYLSHQFSPMTTWIPVTCIVVWQLDQWLTVLTLTDAHNLVQSASLLNVAAVSVSLVAPGLWHASCGAFQ